MDCRRQERKFQEPLGNSTLSYERDNGLLKSGNRYRYSAHTWVYNIFGGRVSSISKLFGNRKSEGKQN